LTEIVYEVTNNQNRSVRAQAIPSYAPKSATEFFYKIRMFLFSRADIGSK